MIDMRRASNALATVRSAPFRSKEAPSPLARASGALASVRGSGVSLPDSDWWDSLKHRINLDALPERLPIGPAYDVQVRDTHWWKYLLAGVAIGATGVWLLSPSLRRRTRSAVSQRTQPATRKITRDLPSTLSSSADNLSNRARGVAHSVRSGVHLADHPEPPDRDQFLKHKVETEVFGRPEVPKGDINIDAAEGVVTVRGTVHDAALIDAIINDVAAVEGVSEVRNYLKTPEELSTLSYTDPRR